jgi:hypothetical protein
VPLTRKWTATAEHGIQRITVTFECPYFIELDTAHGGRLLRDNFEVHALWDYYGKALIAHKRAKANLVYEDELSLVFDRDIARQLFMSTAAIHGVRPDDMVRYWSIIHQQRIAMGGKDQLPEEFEFRYWGN